MKTGDFITITKWKGRDDTSFFDSCLEVTAIDKNLARVKEHRSKKTYYKWTLNLDEVETRTLNCEFVHDVLNSEDLN